MKKTNVELLVSHFGAAKAAAMCGVGRTTLWRYRSGHYVSSEYKDIIQRWAERHVKQNDLST